VARRKASYPGVGRFLAVVAVDVLPEQAPSQSIVAFAGRGQAPSSLTTLRLVLSYNGEFSALRRASLVGSGGMEGTSCQLGQVDGRSNVTLPDSCVASRSTVTARSV